MGAIKNKYFVGCVLLFSLIAFNLSGQDEEIQNPLETEDAIREEIQRYFGYEDLLYRYLTLPYDVSNQINLQGRFVDIGYPLFALLPILLLLLVYQNKRRFYGLMAALLVYLSLCFRFSFLFDNNYQKYNPSQIDQRVSQELVGFEDGILTPFYMAAGWIANPIYKFLDGIAGQNDHITYPIICLLFLATLFFILKTHYLSEKSKTISIIFFSFSFLWWMLSSGIIWYGFLMIPMGYLILTYGMQWKSADLKFPSAHRFVRFAFFLTMGTWVFLSFTSRVSNVIPTLSAEHPSYGTTIVDLRIYPYSVGLTDKKASLNGLAANLSLALDKMNSDSSFILQIGTSLAFDINQNDKRIYEDNSVSFFYDVVEEYRTPQKTREALLDMGFKYIIVDLKLPSIDRTPERSLTYKYGLLTLKFLKNNPYARLIATDQVIEKNGQNVMGVFAEGRPKVYGSYAVFELL